MFTQGTKGRRSRIAGCAIILGLALAVADSDLARATEAPQATSAPANFCKVPSSPPALASGLVLLCGKRLPAGVFLGSFLSPAESAVDDCVKRCAADSQCKAFTLDGRDLPNGRACTLFGSQEGSTDATAWVSGIRLPDNDPGRMAEILRRYGGRVGNAAVSNRIDTGPVLRPADETPTAAPTDNEASDTPRMHRYAKKAAKRPSATATTEAEPPSERPASTSAEGRPPITAAPPPSTNTSASRPSTNTLAPPIANPISAPADTTTLQQVYFATDRTPGEAGAALEASFVAGWTPTISYGLTMVNIPKSHRIGNVERPWFNIFKLKYEDSDADVFRIKALKPLDRATFVKDLQDGADSVLLFVHGYNVVFADAVFKAAQIAYDANFPGSVVVFSWPSAGQVLKYDQDHANAQAAVPHLAEIFRLLSGEIGKKNVYIVAHSMGNQVLVNALVQSALSKADIAVNELVMAAPDVALNDFQSEFDQIRAVATNITLYASSADKALLASTEKSHEIRLGYVGSTGPNIFPGIDTIDVTAVGDDMLGLDHSTFSTSRVVLDDLGRLIRSPTHLKPNMRTPELRLMSEQANLQYWLYPR
jgi:esterase/lipase superfamily enzyme